MSIFEYATRKKLRFVAPGINGSMSVEDLWDLPLTKLDKVAIALNKELKEEKEESFIVSTSKSNKPLNVKFEIVKHIISTKMVEKEAANNAAAKKAEKQKLLALIADKENEALKGKSLEELKAMASQM